MLDEPTFPGCLVLARPVGVFWMHDERGPGQGPRGARADPRNAGVRDLGRRAAHLLDEIGDFFDIYKELEQGNRPTSAAGRTGPRPSR